MCCKALLLGLFVISTLFLLPGAGLAGRLGCQNCLKSLPISDPVLVQLFLMELRSSETWRRRSSSFFFNQETLSSWREAPRLNWRAIYFS